METLEELKNTYKKLQEESNNLYSKIKALEKRNAISKFTVGDCYLNTKWNNLIKIVSIKDNYIYYICLDKDCITRDYSYIYDIEDWEADLFSHYRKESQYPFRCIGCSRKYCIPYEGNEHLLGIRNNPE